MPLIRKTMSQIAGNPQMDRNPAIPQPQQPARQITPGAVTHITHESNILYPRENASVEIAAKDIQMARELQKAFDKEEADTKQQIEIDLQIALAARLDDQQGLLTGTNSSSLSRTRSVTGAILHPQTQQSNAVSSANSTFAAPLMSTSAPTLISSSETRAGTPSDFDILEEPSEIGEELIFVAVEDFNSSTSSSATTLTSSSETRTGTPSDFDTLEESSEIPDRMIDENIIRQELQKWIEDPQAFGNKQNVAYTILESFHNKDSGVYRFTKMFLGGLGLTILPPCLKYLTSVEMLDLSHNYLTEASLSSLPPALKKLDISHNKLKTFSPSPSSKLEELKICNNELTEFSCSSLMQLKQLDIKGNSLKTLIISSHSKIEHINANYNRLERVFVSSLLALNSLWLEYNKISDFVFEDLPELEIMHAGNNRLESVPPLNLPKLKQLHLSHNQLQGDLSLPSLDYLENCYLDNNNLKSVNFPPLASLEILHLNNNKELSSVPPEINNCPRLWCLSVRDNLALKILPLSKTIQFLHTEGSSIPNARLRHVY